VALDCTALLDRLEAFLDGRLDPAECRAVERHLAGCGDCRELTQRLREPPGKRALEPPGDLIGSVLIETSGPVCARARADLCDWIDGELVAFDGELVRSHVACCVDCRVLARCLAALGDDLPMLAELEPDPAFVADVLERTLPRRTARPRWAARIVAGWRRLIQRPRFALEGAYAGAMVLVLLVGIPNAPLAGVPRKALDLASVNPVEELKRPAAELESRLGIDSAVSGTFRRVRSSSHAFAADIGHQAKRIWSKAEESYGTLSSRFASGEATNETKETENDSQQDDGDGS
jgi:anti-sigma factor RsiW